MDGPLHALSLAREIWEGEGGDADLYTSEYCTTFKI